MMEGQAPEAVSDNSIKDLIFTEGCNDSFNAQEL